MAGKVMQTKMERFFRFIERVGNKLPHPFILFLYLCVIVILLSALAGWLGWSEFNPDKNEMVVARNVLSGEGLVSFLQDMVDNFTDFRPLGLVLVMLMGLSVAEKSGFLETLISGVVRRSPQWLVIPIIVIVGACGNIGSNAGVVIVPPLAAIVFKRMGHHPLAGFVLGYASATAGFTANLVPAGTDVLLAAITSEVYSEIEKGSEVIATCNWYFIFVATFVLAIVFTPLVKRFTIPMCVKYPDTEFVKVKGGRSTRKEKKGVIFASLAGFAYLIVVMFTIVPEDGLLRHPDPDQFMRSPFFKSLIPILFFLFVFVGLAYGKIVGTIKKSSDVAHMVIESMRAMGPFIALAFMIAQFIGFLRWSHLDQLLAIQGAEFLQKANFSGLPLFISFIILTAFLNFVLTSASAKWAIIAPIFVTMLYYLNVSPAGTQLLYRIGDSTTNGITPLYSMYPLILGWVEQYDKKAGIGTVTSLLLPYMIFSMLAWIALIVIWYLIGLPIGVGETLIIS